MSDEVGTDVFSEYMRDSGARERGTGEEGLRTDKVDGRIREENARQDTHYIEIGNQVKKSRQSRCI